MNSRTTAHRRVAAVLASLAIGAVTLTACAGADATGEPGAAPTSPAAETDASELQSGSGVPEECLDAFPVALGAPDPAAATLAPADWPADAVSGVLCQTTETPDGTRQSLEYATDLSPEDVLDQLEAALPASYEATRSDQGLGEQIDGSAGAVHFTVTVRPGAYAVAFGTD
ncbi:hypothetical protein GON03_14150 [Nocardioides sp. MAH-18]|uniref:DUF4333 domain-containing protein n=1 Tax=Nocardioides agri TaxID=2682843 RepID=A0A6L6XUA6_9ACTN|nr:MULTISPECIES: hypothetical protein [unclassified Nocardioides]MBA2955473.1 hypothetical protein [Nocardioides sp. CGMCC 1.13656]MVQ50323.1 hypothetical protein [Nocardioides sp. MAH-18]